MKHLFLCLVASLFLFSCSENYHYGEGVLVDRSTLSDLSQDELDHMPFLFEGDSYWVVAMKNGDTINAILTQKAWGRIVEAKDITLKVQVSSASGIKGGSPVIY